MARYAARALCILTLDWLPPQCLSPNSRVYRTERWAAVRATREAIYWQVVKAQWPRQAKDGPRRRLTIHMTRPRLMDPDNAVALVKSVVDGVRQAGALHDDGERWLELVVTQAKGRAGMTLMLEELS